MGTEKESFVELTERIGRKTGGLSVSPFVSDKRSTDEPVALVMISGKAMSDKAADLLDLFRDVLLTARLDDRERFKQVPRRPTHFVLHVCFHLRCQQCASCLLHPPRPSSHCKLLSCSPLPHAEQ